VILLNRKFLLLWFSQICSQFAERFFLFVLVLIVYDKLGHTNAGVALLGLAFGLPAIVLGPVAGVVVDLIDRKIILWVINILRGVVLGVLVCLPGLLESGHLLLFFAVLVSSLSQFFIPSELASLSQIVKSKKELLPANSIFITSVYLIGVFGFTLGSMFVAKLSPSFFLGAASVLFFSSAAFLLFLPPLNKHLSHHTVKNFWVQLWRGLGYVKSQKSLRNLLWESLLISTVFSTLTVLGVGFVDQAMQLPKEQFGFLTLVGGLGLFLGIIFLNVLHARKWPLFQIIFWGLGGGGLSFLVFALSNQILLSLAALAVAGFFFAWIMISIQSGLQIFGDKAHQGQIMSLQNMILNFALTFPVFLLGHLADHTGIRFVFVLLAGLLLVEFLRLSLGIRKLIKLR
jgi:MFS family permease